MRSPSRARAAFLLLYGALLAWQVDRWFFTPHGLVSTWADRHVGLTASSGSPRGLAQTFVMGADGLHGIWLRPVVEGHPAGDLVVDVSEIRGEARIRLERVVVPAARAAASASLHVPLRAQRRSRGRVLQVDLRHVRAGSGPALDFAVTREDRLPNGRLVADGVEQWGDLVLETSAGRATLPYWIHEVLEPWPDWVRAWPTIVVVLLLLNVVLAWACAVAAGLVRERDGVPATRAPVAVAPEVVGRAARLSAVAVTLAGILVVLRPAPPVDTLDLIDALPDAHVETTHGTLHDGVSPEPVVFGGRVRRSIVALPTTTMAWTIEVPRDAVLRLGAAMRPDMWYVVSDGIQMSVAIEHAGGRTVAAELTLFPMGVVEHQRLFPVEVPLQPWAGQRVRVVLHSTPERWGNAVNDVPVWTEPRIEWPRRRGASAARVVRP